MRLLNDKKAQVVDLTRMQVQPEIAATELNSMEKQIETLNKDIENLKKLQATKMYFL